MIRKTALAVMVLSIMIATAGRGYAQFPPWAPPGPNIAAGKSYTWSAPPDYYLSTDEGDKTQLTDGQFAPVDNHMWWFKPTVGWFAATVGVTIDLGEVKSIGGAMFSTDTRPESGVGWPRAILVLVSDDGKEFRLAGELLARSAKFGVPPALGRYRFVTDEIQTRGRYVQFVAQGSHFVFVDEIEVYAGKPENLNAAATGPVIADPPAHLKEFVTSYAAAGRIAIDTAHARLRLAALEAPKKVRKSVSKRLDALYVEAQTVQPVAVGVDYRAIVPVNPLQAQVLAAMVPAYRAAGYPEYWAWQTNRWVRQTHWDLPPAPKEGAPALPSLRVHMMRNERRGEVVSIANFSPAAKTAVVSFAGLPGGAMPAYVDVLQAEVVAQFAREWDADALPAAEKTAGGWRVSLPAGMSRQLWLDFYNPDAPACPSGTHAGEVVVKVDGGPELRVPLELKVSSYRMPAPRDRAVAVSAWDYVAGKSERDVALITHMRRSGLNAPWGPVIWDDVSVFPLWGKGMGKVNEKGDALAEPMDFSAFDRWVDLWPSAKYFMFYSQWGWVGTWEEGERRTRDFTPEDIRRLGVPLKAWADHIRQRGLDPARIAILVVDEIAGGENDRLTLNWAKAIKAAVPEFKLYVDPNHGPAQFKEPTTLKMFEHMDIITPGCSYIYGDNWNPEAIAFYDQWRAQGKIMGFYACSQTASQTDPTAYYRLQQWHCWDISKGGSNSWSGFWSYIDVRGNQPWNQLECGRDNNWSPVYLDSKSVTDGKHWLAIFEGQQDYEYLLMLKTRLAELKQAGREDEKTTAAQKVLDTVVAETIATVIMGDQARDFDFSKTDVYAELRKLGDKATGRAADSGGCDTGRLRVLEALESLAE